MKCREAISLLCSEPDAPLEVGARSRLAEHLAECPACRHAREDMAAALAAWRAESARAVAPDPLREWQAVRRRMRGADAAANAVPPLFRRRPSLWLAVPAVAAVAIAALFVVPRHPATKPSGPPAPAIARVDSVEVPGAKASTMVFVDDKSGWLIVWASDANGKRG